MLLRAVWACALLGPAARASDVAIGAGAGPHSGNASFNPTGARVDGTAGATLLLNGGFDFLKRGNFAFGVEIPLALHGATRASVSFRGQSTSIYTEQLSMALTPAVRARFAPQRSLSPWISFGAGLARIHRTGQDFYFANALAAQVGTSRGLALMPAAGVDVRLARRWFVRAEFRDYIYRTPANGFVSSFAFWNRWNFNPMAGASLGLRF